MSAAPTDRDAHHRMRFSRLASFAALTSLSLLLSLAACERGRADAAAPAPAERVAAATGKPAPLKISGSIACEPGAATHAAADKGDAIEADTPGSNGTRTFALDRDFAISFTTHIEHDDTIAWQLHDERDTVRASGRLRVAAGARTTTLRCRGSE